MRNINKLIALGLLLIFFSSVYLFSLFNKKSNKDGSKIPVNEQVPFEKATEEERILQEPEEITSEKISKQSVPYTEKQYFAESYPLENGWGYRINKDHVIIIEQKHIPAINKIVCFSSREQAQQVADLVIKKIKKGIFPPAITIAELDSLKIIY